MTAGVTTLGALRTRLEQQIDRVGSDFFSNSEKNQYLSDSYKELYDILVQKFGSDYFVATPHTFTTDGTNDTFALPDDFYKLIGVDISLTGATTGGWVTLKQFMTAERNRFSVPNYQNFYGRTNLRYRLRGSTLWFTPIPASGQSVRVFYVPRPTELTSDSDTVDGISGWEEYVVCDAAIKCLAKEESDPSVFLHRKAALLKRIEEAAENRNQGNPQTVQDVQGGLGSLGDWSSGWGWGY